MRLISESKFDQLKSEHGIKLTISYGKVYFDDNNIGFPIEQASFYMTIAYFIVYTDFLEIGYFLEDSEVDPQYSQTYSITFTFDRNEKFISFFN